ASSESVFVAERQVFSRYNIDFSTLSFGRKRKTPYGFEMYSGTLCVSKKGNLATCSDYIDNSRHISCTSSNINCPTKETVSHQHLMDHVCMQPEKAFVLSECPLQKKVADKVNCSKKQQAQANDQKIYPEQVLELEERYQKEKNVTECAGLSRDRRLRRLKKGSEGTMEWAKEKMKQGYEATKVRAVKGLEAEKERSDAALDKFYSKIESHPYELQQQIKGIEKWVKLASMLSPWNNTWHYQRIPDGTINTWDLLEKAFIQRYSSPSKVGKQLEEIHNFKHEGDETFYQA
nr:hypothetical protein [Tanacetum cinerariifolium]